MKKLKDSDVDINKPSLIGIHSGATPLWLASFSGKVEAVQLLLSWGADHTIADANGELPVGIKEDGSIMEGYEWTANIDEEDRLKCCIM